MNRIYDTSRPPEGLELCDDEEKLDGTLPVFKPETKRKSTLHEERAGCCC